MRLCVRWGPFSLPQKGAQPLQFSARVYCGQTAGWIKMVLGTDVDLSPGYFVFDGDPAPSPKRGGDPSSIFGPFLLWPNGCMDQDSTWYGGRPRPDDIVLGGDPAPPTQKGGRAPSPIFGPCPLWPNGWMNQDDTWHGGGSWPRPHCVRWGPSSPSQKGQSPQFLAHFYCGQTAGCVKMPLGMEVGLSPGDFVLDWDPVPPQKGAEPPIFGRLLWPNGCMDQDAT